MSAPPNARRCPAGRRFAAPRPSARESECQPTSAGFPEADSSNSEYVAIEDAAVQQFIRELRQSDEVELTYTEAVAVDVTPAPEWDLGRIDTSTQPD
jgi:hypothetical protein